MTEQLEKILNDLPYSIRHSGEIAELEEEYNLGSFIKEEVMENE